MAQRSSKHSEVKTTIAGFDGGLNLYDGSSNIADNQLVDCRNFFYADEGDELVTRPGVKVVSRVKIGEVLLTVNLHPAQGGWRIVGSANWYASGVSISLSAGAAYTLEYQDVAGYRTPGGSTVTLVYDTVVEAYYRYLYSLTINLSLPDEVVNPVVTVVGVSAQPDSTRTQRNFKAVSDQYEINYGGVTGYIKPDDEECDLQNDATLNRYYYKDIVNYGFRAMAYGNGVYVGTRETMVPGGGSIGNIYTSIDGVNWELVKSFTVTASQYTCHPSVAFGNGVFVWVGKTEVRNISATSVDGVNWYERATLTSGVAGDLSPAIFCNGVFFTSVDNYEGIFHSIDGLSWGRFSTARGILQAKYFGSKYYFKYTSTYYHFSQDLINLTSSRGDLPASSVLFDLEVYAGMIFTAAQINSTGKGQFFHSADGSHWTSVPCSLDFTETRRFIKTENYWFMSCLLPNMTASTPTLYRSIDLQTWAVVPTYYGLVNNILTFSPYDSTRFYDLNGKLYVSDPSTNRTLVIEDI